MFQHNILITYRNFLRHKSSFFINMVGLSTGLACVLLIYLWVADEVSIDQFHQKDARLYQVMNNLKFSQEVQTWHITPAPLAAALAEEMPEVEHAVAVNDFFSWQSREGTFSFEGNATHASGWHAGKDFFDVFSYDLIQGNKELVLADKNNVALSEDLAKKIFKTTDHVVGKTLNWKHPFFEGVFQVSGIFKAPPANSTAQFDFLISTDVLLDNDRWAKEWKGNSVETFVVLKEGTSIQDFNSKIAGFLKLKDSRVENSTLFVQQFSDKYLHGRYENGLPAGGRITYVKLFSIVALFILLIACINFMNLSTAQASLKMKEIAIKKTVGTSRGTLAAQFLTESLMTTFLSLLIALLLVALFLPRFNDITGKHLQLTLDPVNMLVIIGIVLLTGLLSGSYPAFYLSRFKPVAILKGKLQTSTQAVFIRKGLVIFQFSLSVLFIVGLLVVDQQIEFTQTKNLGYDRENIVSFQWKGELFNRWNGLGENGKSNLQFETFMSRLKNVPGVSSATHMSGNILNEMYGQSGVSWRGQETDRNYVFQSPIVGYDFIETLGIELKEGRTFSKDFHDDYSKIILNEAAVSLMELKDPVGRKIQMNGSSEIIGVVKNFHYGSLHGGVEPLIFRCDPTGRNVMVRIEAGAEQATIEQLRKLSSELLPGYAFEFTFMDADYQALYNSESRIATLSQYFSAIAMIISCLGLFGLAAFTAQRRQKEIGVRKVLGATELHIIRLLSSDFMKIVLTAIVIALPMSYWISRTWLASFAYRIELQWWYFISAGGVALVIAWLTIGMQTLKAARTNPVDILKNE